jgi:hypothetical protein
MGYRPVWLAAGKMAASAIKAKKAKPKRSRSRTRKSKAEAASSEVPGTPSSPK